MSDVTGITLRGMTWSHPRGFDPLQEMSVRSREPGPLHVGTSVIEWDHQTLAGFESRPIAEIAETYDLIVLDHPGLGAAINAGLLLPLDELVGPDQIEEWRERFIGASADAYHYQGHQWAVPIDGATQVGARRADLLDQPLTSWQEVIDRSRVASVVLPTLAPHALLTLLGIAAAIDPLFEPSAESLIPRQTGARALEILGELIGRMSSTHRLLDPIMVLDRMQGGDDIASSPLIYGYVTYAGKRGEGRSITFDEAPSVPPLGVPGSVLGGTGLAISSRTEHATQALEHLRLISGHLAQTSVIPDSNGQPADRSAWLDRKANAARDNFYLRTLNTQLTAWRRPRYNGWITCQENGSHLVYEGLTDRRKTESILDDLDALYRQTRGERFL